MKFNYQSYAIRVSGTSRYVMVYRPVIAVDVVGPNGVEELRGLVDTGADDTLLPDDLIESLGLVVIPGDTGIIKGIDGGKIPVQYARVNLILPGYRWSARVGLHGGFNTILGHAGFLEYFTATFNGQRRHLTLTPNGTAPASTVPGI